MARLRCAVAAVVAVVAIVSVPVTAGAEEYRPPVEGQVVDPFRPPAEVWQAGNRGIDYQTGPDTPVLASASGQVIFAGQVASDWHVTLEHADGLRTSYSYLASVAVTVGEQVPLGGVVGTSAGRFHFGVRAPDGTYLDPQQLVAAPVARLVPGGDDGAMVIAGPDQGGFWSVLWQLLVDGASLGPGGTVGLLPDLNGLDPALLHYLSQVVAGGNQREALAGIAAALGPQSVCTPPSDPTPERRERRILLLVAGYGSSSEEAGIDGVDAAALGYEMGDVVRFSYRGGVIPDLDRESARPGQRLSGLSVRPYTASDSLGDLSIASQYLGDLVADIARSEPGVPIDLVGHSQGGVVARRAVVGAATQGTLPPELATLVTLGSPHGGADLATAGSAVASTPGGQAVLNLGGGLGLPVSADAPALHQLAETAPGNPSPDPLTADLSFPSGVRFTSVAARGDPVVPSIRSQVATARNTTVSVTGPGAHDALPGSPEATREIALAVGGLPPTCRSTPDRLVDAAAGHGMASAQDGIGAALSSLAALL